MHFPYINNKMNNLLTKNTFAANFFSLEKDERQQQQLDEMNVGFDSGRWK